MNNILYNQEDQQNRVSKGGASGMQQVKRPIPVSGNVQRSKSVGCRVHRNIETTDANSLPTNTSKDREKVSSQ